MTSQQGRRGCTFPRSTLAALAVPREEESSSTSLWDPDSEQEDKIQLVH